MDGALNPPASFPDGPPPLHKGGAEEEPPTGNPTQGPDAGTPEGPGAGTPEGGLSGTRPEQLLAYCKLTELADDPEVEALIPALYSAAVGYMDSAGVSLPEEGTPRRAQYDLCVNYLVLDSFERRETAMVATVVADNPAFRRLLNQLKLTEPEAEL